MGPELLAQGSGTLYISGYMTGGSDQNHPQNKKCKKANWLSEEALQIAEERREAKGKGEKETYTHMNAEFQRIARRDKKAFLLMQRNRGKQQNAKDKISSRKLEIPREYFM